MNDFERDALLQHINHLVLENVALRQDLDRVELQCEDVAEKLRLETDRSKLLEFEIRGLETEISRLEEDLVWAKESLREAEQERDWLPGA